MCVGNYGHSGGVYFPYPVACHGWQKIDDDRERISRRSCIRINVAGTMALPLLGGVNAKDVFGQSTDPKSHALHRRGYNKIYLHSMAKPWSAWRFLNQFL